MSFTELTLERISRLPKYMMDFDMYHRISDADLDVNGLFKIIHEYVNSEWYDETMFEHLKVLYHSMVLEEKWRRKV